LFYLTRVCLLIFYRRKRSLRKLSKTTFHLVAIVSHREFHYSLSSTESTSMRGVKRVFAFCCLSAVLPALLIICPLYLKHQVFRDHVYNVTESDILEVRDGISTIFCQEHALKMSTSFSAFQLHRMPNQAKARKPIRLKKSMILPDDTLEYWGFYLLKGATVELKVCS
jgi:hypothetical protein